METKTYTIEVAFQLTTDRPMSEDDLLNEVEAMVESQYSGAENIDAMVLSEEA